MPDYNCEHCHDTGVCPPPEGYDTWLDYAVDTLTDLPLNSSSFYESPPPHRRDMRAAARAELEALRAIADKWEQTMEECSSCHGTGFVSIHENNINSPWRELWLQADKENITGDGWHRVPCPDCKEKQ